MSKQYKPNIVRGGVAVPLGNNYFFMKGRKHKQGGIDVGKDLEVEDGEVMKLTKDNIKVFSAVPFLNGQSPVEKLLGGEDPNKVFAQQERFKKVNKINDDGTKAQLGKGKKITTTEIPESQQYAVTTPDGQRKVFNSKQEASDYVTANTPKGYSLYDTTNYGTNIDKGQTAILNRNTEREVEKATKQEELAKARLATRQQNQEIGKEMLSYMPVIGDGMDLYQLGKDVYNKQYGNAAITAAALAMPAWADALVKPIGKAVRKGYNKIKNTLNTNNNFIDYTLNKNFKTNNIDPLTPQDEFSQYILFGNEDPDKVIKDYEYGKKHYFDLIDQLNYESEIKRRLYGEDNIPRINKHIKPFKELSLGERYEVLPEVENIYYREHFNDEDVKNYDEIMNYINSSYIDENSLVKSTSDINKKNIGLITDYIWDDLYYKAVKNNNLDEIQKLRDLHFKQKAIGNKNNKLQYHGIANAFNPNFTVFNPKENHKSIFTSDDLNISTSYVDDFVTPDEIEEGIQLFKDKTENEINEYLTYAYQHADYPFIDKKHIKQAEEDLKKLGQMSKDELRELTLKANPYSPNRIKKLYTYLKNPIIFDNKGEQWSNISINNLPKDIQDLLYKNNENIFPQFKTKNIEDISRKYGYDGVIIDNMLDFAGGSLYKNINYNKPAQIVITNDPKKLKLADPITYDDKGKIIPLSKRDDFTNPDIRYSWLLPTIGLGTGLSLINNDKQNVKRFGGKINKFRNGGDITPEEQALWRANHTIKPASNYHAAKDMNITKTREDMTDFVQKNFPNIGTGLTNCTLTASQFYGKPIGRAATIVNNPEDNNFYQVDEKHAIPGTMVIASDPIGTKDPKYHTMILSGYADKDYPFEYNGIKYNIKKGEPLVHYSKGKNTPESYKKSIPLRVYNDQGEGKTYNRFYRPYDKNGLPNVLLPELIVTNKKVMGGKHKLNTNQIANIYRVDSNGKTTWGMNFSTGDKSKSRQKAELGLKTKNDGSYYGYTKKDNKGNTWYIPTHEDLKLMYPGLAEDVDYNTLSDYDKMRYNEREAVKDGYRVRDTGEIFYVDDNTTFVNSGPTFNNTVDARDVNREIPKTYVSTKSNSSKSTTPKLKRKYWNNLSTYEDRLDYQVEPNKTNVVTPNTIKSTTNNKSVNYSVTNKKQATPKQTTPSISATVATPKSNVTTTTPKQTAPNNVTRTAPRAKSTSQETPIFGLDAQNAFKKSIIGSKANPDYIRGTFDFRDNKELVNKIDPNTIKVNPTNIRYKGAPSNGGYFKNYNAGDYISLGANVLGNIGSALINANGINKKKYNSAPIPKISAKLDTDFNINSQLDHNREILHQGISDIDANTSSSNVGVNRKNQLRLANIMNTNKLYNTEENVETELINKDRLNQQNVANSNIDDYNKWSEKEAAFNNAKLDKLGENRVSLVQGLSQGVHDFINNNEKRKQFNNNLIAIMAANPNVNPELYKILGADWATDERIRNWKLANNYKV